MPHQPLSVKIFFCFGVAIFGLGGIGILRMAFTELARVFRRKKHLVKVPGRIISIEKERRYRAGSSDGSRTTSSYWIYYFPIIVFTRPDGQPAHFRSELGEHHRIRRNMLGVEVPPPPPSWEQGQEVGVFYDPAGEIKPCLAVAWSLWFTGIGMLVAGSLFLTVAILMAIFGGPRVFA